MKLITRKQATEVSKALKEADDLPFQISSELVYDIARGRREGPIVLVMRIQDFIPGSVLVPTQAVLVQDETVERGKQIGLLQVPAKPKKSRQLGFDYDSGEWLNLTDDMIAGWESSWPGIDVPQELETIRNWLFACTPSKRKKHHAQFVVNWLSRKHAEVGSRPSKTEADYDKEIAGYL